MSRPLGLLLLLAGALVVIGAFFSWFDIGVGGITKSITGMDSSSENLWWHNIAPGWWALVGGGVIIVAGLIVGYTRSRSQRRAAVILGATMAVLVALFSYLEYSHAKDTANRAIQKSIESQSGSSNPFSAFASALIHTSMGTGLVITFVGCGIALLVGIILAATSVSSGAAEPG